MSEHNTSRPLSDLVLGSPAAPSIPSSCPTGTLADWRLLLLKHFCTSHLVFNLRIRSVWSSAYSQESWHKSGFLLFCGLIMNHTIGTMSVLLFLLCVGIADSFTTKATLLSHRKTSNLYNKRTGMSMSSENTQKILWDDNVEYVDLNANNLDPSPTSRTLPLFLLGSNLICWYLTSPLRIHISIEINGAYRRHCRIYAVYW